ncbi:MAG: ATP synthase F1 subunit delta [Balneolaceae bacterium]|nr:MAG: ATP synthase F1 subunit delta [Balneolaceae bacterium]
MSSTAAKRYANAFLKTVIEEGKLEKAKDDISLISNTLESSKELRLFLKNRIISSSQKRAALESIFSDKTDKLTFGLIKLLLDKKRENLLEQISGNFLALYNHHHGIIEANIYSASKLDDKQQKALIKELEQSTGKKVKINAKIQEDLLGGLMVRIDDTVIDGSVKFKLNQLKEKFTSAAVE